MKNFDNIGIDPGKLIQHDKLVNYRGGDYPEECVHATCYGGNVGEWYGVYDTAGDLQDAINAYCSSGMAEIEMAYGMDCWGIE